ncbi:MAG: hypothetical protein JSS49_04080 [Planctomycetes bacterium]|nr:hypothetical protein [Planctomycetota bacterium]
MDEPNLVIRWAMSHFASGDSYLSGLLIFVVCQVALQIVRGPRRRRWLIVGNRVALIWSLAVLPPVPWLLAGGFTVLLLSWMISQWRNRKSPVTEQIATRERLFRSGLAAVAMLGIAVELSRQFIHIPDVSLTALCIVGDSVTAGLNDGDDTWPQQLARQVDIQILDASQPGATLKSALKQVALLKTLPGELLLLEVGGNDLLEGLPPEEFERDLDQLLGDCQAPQRLVIMFELPFPPLAIRYASIQRSLAQQHQVLLIPRRHFLHVLTSSGSTVDGIHLSAAGHRRMMEFVQSLLQIPKSKSPGGNYRHVEQARQSGRKV